MNGPKATRAIFGRLALSPLDKFDHVDDTAKTNAVDAKLVTSIDAVAEFFEVGDAARDLAASDKNRIKCSPRLFSFRRW